MDPDVAEKVYALERRLRAVEERVGIDPLDADPDAEVLDLLSRGRKIEAIKAYRERTGAGLKEAKDAVDRIEKLQFGLESE
jgi:hypothetical protein